MFMLKVVQALHGDCLILAFGSHEDPHYILIDGGPSQVYRDYMKKELLNISSQGGKLELALLSHVDDDHIRGLLDLLKDLVKQRRKGEQETITIEGFWLNSFGQALGDMVEKSMARQMERNLLPVRSRGFDFQARSIKQGYDLTAFARGLGIPINAEFRDSPDRLVCAENMSGPIQLANLKAWVIGPTHQSLHDLQTEWEDWLAKREQVAALPPEKMKAAARELDQSVPNLSSIMLLVEGEGKTVLLSGDGLGKHIVGGLRQAGLLHQDGTFHVDVFKLPHHGSARNITAELFRQVTADTYVICADGTNDNPDYQTLEWLVGAAKEQNRQIHIVATTETPSIKALQNAYPPEKSCYTLSFIGPDDSSITLDMSRMDLSASAV